MRKMMKLFNVLLITFLYLACTTDISVAAEGYNQDYVTQVIKECNETIDAVKGGKIDEQALRKLRKNMETVAKIPEENLNNETKELIKRYNNADIKKAINNLNIEDKKKEIDDTVAAMKDPKTSAQTKTALQKQLTDKQGELKSLEVEKGKIEKEKGSTKCAPYKYYEPVKNCFLCPIFSTMFNTVNGVTEKAITSYSDSVARVVIVAFAIWLALLILRFVSSIETKDLKDLVQAIITQAFVVALVVLILETGVSKFFNTFVTPIYLTGQSAAQVVFTHAETSAANEQITMISEEYKDGFSPEIGRSIIKTMTTIENAISKFRALGVSIMCYSFTAEANGILFFPNFLYLLTGVVLWTFATVLIVALPFLMIDSVFQLGVVGALMPPAIGAAAFKYTRSKYTKPVWDTFLNSMFAFVFISMVVLLLLGVLKQSLTYNMGSISQTVGESVQAEAVANGEKSTESNATASGTAAGGSEDAQIKSLAQQHKQSFVKHEGAKLNVYLDYKGYPTVGIGHLLFREGSFDAWYRDKINGMEFMKNGKTLSVAESKSIFQRLYNSCVAKGHTTKQMKVKGEMTSVKVWGCDASIIQGLQISQSQMDKTYEKDFSIAYKKTAKNSKCESSNAEVIWKTFNRGNAGHCGKTSTSSNTSSSSGATSSAAVSTDTTNFDLMFTEGGDGYNYFKEMLSTFHWRSWHFIRMVFVFILAWSVMNMAKEFAGEMASSISNTSIGSSIGTMAASGAKGMAVRAGKPLAKAAGQSIGRGVRNMGRKAGNKIAGAWTAYKIKKSQQKMKAGSDGKSYVDDKGFKHQMAENGETEVISRERELGATTRQEANGNTRTVSKKEEIKRYRSKEMTIEVKKIIETTIIKNREGKIINEVKAVSVEEKVSFHSLSPKDLVGRNGKVNQKLIDKLMEGKSSEEKERIQRAVMKKIHEQRFARTHEKKMKSPPELVSQITLDDGTIEMTYKFVTTKGETVFQTTRLRTSGYVETHQTIVNAKGEITMMSSDGLRNRLVTAKLENPAALDNAKNYKEICDLAEKNTKGGSFKARYSYSKYAQDLINHGVDPRDIGFDEDGKQLGMMSMEGAVGKESPFENFVWSKGHEFEKAKIATDIIC